MVRPTKAIMFLKYHDVNPTSMTGQALSSICLSKVIVMVVTTMVWMIHHTFSVAMVDSHQLKLTQDLGTFSQLLHSGIGLRGRHNNEHRRGYARRYGHAL